jgi:hypothetical protein
MYSDRAEYLWLDMNAEGGNINVVIVLGGVF